MDVRLPNGKVIRGVPEGTPKAEIMRKAIAAGIASESDFPQQQVDPQTQEAATTQATDYQQQYGQQQAPYSYGTQRPAQTQGFDPSASRETRATRELPELPEAAGFLSGYDVDKVAPVAAAIISTANDQEVADILQANFPDIGIQYDEAGNIIAARNTPEGPRRVVINKPGLSKTDLLQTLGIGTALFPSGRAARASSLAGRVGLEAAEAGARSTALQAGQEAVGGEFDTGDVILDVVTAGGAEFLPSVFKSLKTRGERHVAQAAEDVRTTQSAAQGAPVTGVTEDVATDIAAQAQARKPDVDVAATQATAQRETVEAAERLGLADDLTPAQVGGSEAYREVEGTIAAVPTTQLSAQRNEAIKKTAKTADDFIQEFGGQFDKAGLSDEVRDNALKNIDNLKAAEKELYTQIDELVPKTAQTNPVELAQLIDQRATELGGIQHLEKPFKDLLDLATNNPTYALLDRERRAIGDALGSALDKGPYAGTDSRMLGQLYDVLTQVQERTAKEYGAAEIWDSAKALTVQRKNLIDDSVLLFGKERAGALMPKIGASVQKLQKGDYEAFDKFMKAVPEEYKQRVIVSALNDAFTTGARRQEALNPAGFADWYGKLSRNKAAKNRLFKYLPTGADKRLNDIYLVSKGIAEAEKTRIKTGVTQKAFDRMDSDGGWLGKIYRLGRDVAVTEGATTALGVPGAGATGVIASRLATANKKDPVIVAADKLLASDQFKAATRNFAKIDQKSIAARERFEKALTSSRMYKQWYELLPSEQKQQIAKAGFMAWLNDEGE